MMACSIPRICSAIALLMATASSLAVEPYEVEVKKDILYGKGQVYEGGTSETLTTKDLLLDAYIPVGAPTAGKPALVLVHGGGWRMGNKEVVSVRNVADYFAPRGYVCFSIAYRLIGDNPATPGGSEMRRGMHAGFRDTKAAVRWVRAHAEQFGIDPNRIGAWGHSAGAYNVIAAAYSGPDEYIADSPDDPTAEFNTPGVSSAPNAVIDCWGGATDAMLQNMTAHSAPLCIFHGYDDRLVPIENGEKLRDRAQEVGLPHQYYDLPNWGHEPWDGPAKVFGKSLNELTLEFLEANMGGNPATAPVE